MRSIFVKEQKIDTMKKKAGKAVSFFKEEAWIYV
jgi:hypothetical protein